MDKSISANVISSRTAKILMASRMLNESTNTNVTLTTPDRNSNLEEEVTLLENEVVDASLSGTDFGIPVHNTNETNTYDNNIEAVSENITCQRNELVELSSNSISEFNHQNIQNEIPGRSSAFQSTTDQLPNTLLSENERVLTEIQSNETKLYKAFCNSDRPTVLRLTKVKPSSFYTISPIHSEESDVDDSDADPDFTRSSSSSEQECDKENCQEKADKQQTSRVALGALTEQEELEGTLQDNDKEETQTQQDNNEQDQERKKKGKKRKADIENWKRKKAKLLRNSGKAYTSLSKTKKEFPERKLRPHCGEKCRLKCSEKISEEVRNKIFSSYWQMGDLEKQREFIISHSHCIKPKYRYSSTENYRSMNNAFYFRQNDTRIRVCKAFFKATLDINDRPIRTALSKRTDTGFVLGDNRGKHGKQPTVDPEIEESVRKFIDAIPRIESHYLRAQTSREFIEGSKSLADIYRDYKEDRQNRNLPFAHLTKFSRIFNEEYNISFFSPKKDQCDLCESYKHATGEEKQNIEEEYNKHLKEKKLSRKEKDKMAHDANDNLNVAVYDLQAVLPVPKGPASMFYYKTKLNCYNFTISDLHAKNVDCYFWTELDGNRGANEIGSCVLQYLQDLVEKNAGNDLHVVFYSDNCSGQQKNKYLLTLYAYAVNILPIQSITHKFLIHGHTQNEGDNAHSVIEKQIQRHIKSGPIYVPEQYIPMIRGAKKNGPPYSVHELTYENFYDLKFLQEQWGSNYNIDTNKIKVKWSDIKVLMVKKDYPQNFYVKTSYEDDEFRSIEMPRKKNPK